MKCSACRDNKCYGDYDYRHRCVGKKEGVECTCSCQASNGEAVVAAISSIGIGVAATAGGIALTVATGGLFALFGGAALAGAGSSLIFSPIQKKIAGECMTIGDTIKDVAVGATIGAITGPIGASGGALAKGASGAAKVALKIAAGSSAGAVSGAIGETVKFISGEEVSAESFAKSIAIGAISGAVGGASSQAASSISNTVSDEVTKAVTRVGVQATSAVATDASLQLIQTGTVDPTKLCLNATGQLIVASTAEVSASAAQRTESYANRKNEEFMKDNNVSPEDAKVFKEIIEEAKTADPDRLNKGKKVGPHKLHKMTREPERKGQIAGDYGPKGDNGRRGAGRVLVQEKRGNVYYVDHTPDHDYANMKKSLPSLLDDPLGNHLRADQINAFSVLNEDDEDEDYKKKN